MRRSLAAVGLALLAGAADPAPPKKYEAKNPANTSPDRPPPVFAYTVQIPDDGGLVITVPFRSGDRNVMIVETLSGMDHVYHFAGGLVSRGHFLPYAEGRKSVPLLACLDGQIPDPRWDGIIDSRPATVLFGRGHLNRFQRESKTPAPPTLGYVTAGAGGADPVLVRVRLGEKRVTLPDAELDGARQKPERRDAYTYHSAVTRVPLTGLTLKTVKGAAVDPGGLAERAAEAPVAVLTGDAAGVDAFWKPLLKPDGVVVSGVPADPEKKKPGK